MSTPVYGSQSFTNVPDVNGTPVMLAGAGTGQLNTGTYASRPAAGTSGNLYIDTTNDTIWRDTGSTWFSLSRVVNVYNVTIPITSGAATLALSNTAPTSASGIQIATQTVTPISATSKFLIMASPSLSSTTANSVQTLMAFQGTTLLATSLSTFSTANNAASNSMHVIASPATTSAVTFTLRAATTAGTLWINATNTFATLFGSSGVNNGFMILEIQP